MRKLVFAVFILAHFGLWVDAQAQPEFRYVEVDRTVQLPVVHISSITQFAESAHEAKAQTIYRHVAVDRLLVPQVTLKYSHDAVFYAVDSRGFYTLGDWREATQKGFTDGLQYYTAQTIGVPNGREYEKIRQGWFHRYTDFIQAQANGFVGVAESLTFLPDPVLIGPQHRDDVNTATFLYLSATGQANAIEELLQTAASDSGLTHVQVETFAGLVRDNVDRFEQTVSIADSLADSAAAADWFDRWRDTPPFGLRSTHENVRTDWINPNIFGSPRRRSSEDRPVPWLWDRRDGLAGRVSALRNNQEPLPGPSITDGIVYAYARAGGYESFHDLQAYIDVRELGFRTLADRALANAGSFPTAWEYYAASASGYSRFDHFSFVREYRVQNRSDFDVAWQLHQAVGDVMRKYQLDSPLLAYIVHEAKTVPSGQMLPVDRMVTYIRDRWTEYGAPSNPREVRSHHVGRIVPGLGAIDVSDVHNALSAASGQMQFGDYDPRVRVFRAF